MAQLMNSGGYISRLEACNDCFTWNIKLDLAFNLLAKDVRIIGIEGALIVY